MYQEEVLTNLFWVVSNIASESHNTAKIMLETGCLLWFDEIYEKREELGFFTKDTFLDSFASNFSSFLFCI